ncbi:Uncharacterized protein dnm_006300 [Desulfonema magnum]|uniref:Uncharacterized protein n=1 Tax=Desulfonema magnum TaxID=45655 RepID=A0A975BFT0_9BACT|nr:Uncharacterized protein dnm_006300 [Desulfonema magnum]
MQFGKVCLRRRNPGTSPNCEFGTPDVRPLISDHVCLFT